MSAGQLSDCEQMPIKNIFKKIFLFWFIVVIAAHKFLLENWNAIEIIPYEEQWETTECVSNIENSKTNKIESIGHWKQTDDQNRLQTHTIADTLRCVQNKKNKNNEKHFRLLSDVFCCILFKIVCRQKHKILWNTYTQLVILNEQLTQCLSEKKRKNAWKK